MAQRDGVEKRRAAVAVDDVHLGTTERHQRLYAVCMPPAGRAVQCCIHAPIVGQYTKTAYFVLNLASIKRRSYDCFVP